MEPSCIRRTGLYVFSESKLSLLNQVLGLEPCLGSLHSIDVSRGSIAISQNAVLISKP